MTRGRSKPEGYCGELSGDELAEAREVLAVIRKKINALLDEESRVRLEPVGKSVREVEQPELYDEDTGEKVFG